MEKIVIVSTQPDKGLIALLNMVFPDCEIYVASSRSRIEALIGAKTRLFILDNPVAAPKEEKKRASLSETQRNLESYGVRKSTAF